MKPEVVDSAASYGIGGSAIVLSLAEIATIAQHIALILGCIIVVIRLIHDAIGLYRRIKNKN